MSFEFYLQCYGQTGRTGFPRTAIWSVFPVDEAASEPDYWCVRNDTKRCHVSVTPLPNGNPNLSHIGIERPCEDLLLWDSLFQILNMGFVLLFFPGGPSIVANKNAASAFSVEIIDPIGQPVCVDSGESIAKIVRES